MNDTKEFFAAAKKSERVIVHFYRGVTPRCEIVDGHLEKLAETHVESRFLKVNVEKNPFLVERLKIIIIPSIVLIRDGKTEHTIRGFDEFGGTDDFSTEDMAYVLSNYKVLNYETDRSEEIVKQSKISSRNHINLYDSRGKASDEFSDDD